MKLLSSLIRSSWIERRNRRVKLIDTTSARTTSNGGWELHTSWMNRRWLLSSSKQGRWLRWKSYVSALPQRHPSDTIGPMHNRVPRFRFSAMALGSTEANETVNYLGKLSGNSLISGSCLAPDGIPQVAEHLASTSDPSVVCTSFIGVWRGQGVQGRKRELDGRVVGTLEAQFSGWYAPPSRIVVYHTQLWYLKRMLLIYFAYQPWYIHINYEK